ncbi:hypothetical protein [Allostreptomyces psammosilenae]|uniref:Small secreted protein n=1 Tax=Allostreptomyces psammosilenae TaxID=1892865 RepID=A0A852ZY86_9ACTN|nr:hypothetical protein [Allostreptomyces psammosilenae]NYI05684.1 hypothetical protein [Allostreptomyces psammosilenae]
MRLSRILATTVSAAALVMPLAGTAQAAEGTLNVYATVLTNPESNRCLPLENTGQQYYWNNTNERAHFYTTADCSGTESAVINPGGEGWAVGAIRVVFNPVPPAADNPR